MHRLLPTSAAPQTAGQWDDLDDAALADAYAYPDRPLLRANMVTTADGAATAGTGLTDGISGEADKRVFGLLRALADGVLVGASTVRKEGYGPAKPRKGWAEQRQAEGRHPAPVIAVVSGRLDLDPQSPLFSTAAVRTIVLTAASAPTEARRQLAEVADVVEVGDAQVDLAAAVAALHARGLTRLLCEGGPRLLAQVVKAGLLDELCLTVSPWIVAGSAPRVVNGVALDVPTSMRVGHLLEQDGFLFCRYVCAGSG